MACSVTKQAARIRAKSIKTANGFAYENAASVAQKSMAMMVAAKYNHMAALTALTKLLSPKVVLYVVLTLSFRRSVYKLFAKFVILRVLFTPCDFFAAFAYFSN